MDSYVWFSTYDVEIEFHFQFFQLTVTLQNTFCADTAHQGSFINAQLLHQEGS